VAKGTKCPTCEGQTGVFENGRYQCSNSLCSTVWWSAFDPPTAGYPRKGYRCNNCANQTVHPVAEISNVNIFRCSTCGSAILEKKLRPN